MEKFLTRFSHTGTLVIRMVATSPAIMSVPCAEQNLFMELGIWNADLNLRAGRVPQRLILLTNGENVVLVDTHVQLCVVERYSFPLVDIDLCKF